MPTKQNPEPGDWLDVIIQIIAAGFKIAVIIWLTLNVIIPLLIWASGSPTLRF